MAGVAGFSRILVGIDFSPGSAHTLQLVRDRFGGAQLRLVHITDARVTAAPDLMGGVTPAMPDAELLRTMEHSDGQRLGTLAQTGEEVEQLVGDPVTGILEAAEAWGADLIVLGTHSKGALEHFFLGSTAEKVVARSKIPVLTVPTK